MDYYIGEIRIWCGTYLPQEWAECNGGKIRWNEYPQLRDVIGTKYGGIEGQYYQLPDLRGRVPLGMGQGPGLSDYPIGKQVGGPYTLTSVPAHTHDMTGINETSEKEDPTGAYLGKMVARKKKYSAKDPDAQLNAGVIADAAKQVQPTSNTQPFLTLKFFICVSGHSPR